MAIPTLRIPLCSYCGKETCDYTAFNDIDFKIMCLECEDFESYGHRDQMKLTEIINEIEG